MCRACILLIVLTISPAASATDWPMWRFDVARTAESPQQVPEDLALLWHRDLPEPRPAFHDVRLQFDAGYEPVVMGRSLFLSSSAEDKVTAFDTETGEQLWEFFTDGPVRLAPVTWQDRVLFGSDDGYFHCVTAATGELVWKFRAVPSGRKVLGNKRLISLWPVRGGPVVQDGRVYFAAGVWPFEGVFIFCLDAATGQRIWVNDSSGHLYGQQPHNAVAIGGIAPQGYHRRHQRQRAHHRQQRRRHGDAGYHYLGFAKIMAELLTQKNALCCALIGRTDSVRYSLRQRLSQGRPTCRKSGKRSKITPNISSPTCGTM